jgi:SAM-dependent methyltransferase
MMWFDKDNPHAVFLDNRELDEPLCDGRRFEVRPDIVADFTDLPFPDSTFRLVVFDQPHVAIAGETSWLAKKYGTLPVDWRGMIRDGFRECMRVLKDHGVLIFKWSEIDISVGEIIEAIGTKPLFGHPTRKGAREGSATHWMCFMKGLS